MQFSGAVTFQPTNGDTIAPAPDNDLIRIAPAAAIASVTIQLPDNGTINLGAAFYFHFDQPVIRVMWNLGANNSTPDNLPTMVAAGQVVRLAYVDSGVFLMI